MLKRILHTVKDQVSGQLINQIGLSKRQSQKVIKVAGDAAANVIGEEAAQGKTEDLMSLFSRRNEIPMDNPIIEKISALFLTKLSSKLNIQGSEASKVNNTIIPVLIKEIASSFNTSNTSDFTAQLSLFKGSARLQESLGSRLGFFFRRK